MNERLTFELGAAERTESKTTSAGSFIDSEELCGEETLIDLPVWHGVLHDHSDRWAINDYSGQLASS